MVSHYENHAMKQTVLPCTVGGSHEPVLTSIKENNPDFVCFFVTSGSKAQVTSKGKVIKASADASKPTLPNIPTQAQLQEHSFKCVEVEPDDLDIVYFNIQSALVDLRQRFPEANFIADYTGGTKTMSAALVNVALETEDVELQLVTGRRNDLQSVKSGSEQAMGASIARVRLHRIWQHGVASGIRKQPTGYSVYASGWVCRVLSKLEWQKRSVGPFLHGITLITRKHNYDFMDVKVMSGKFTCKPCPC